MPKIDYLEFNQWLMEILYLISNGNELKVLQFLDLLLLIQLLILIQTCLVNTMKLLSEKWTKKSNNYLDKLEKIIHEKKNCKRKLKKLETTRNNFEKLMNMITINLKSEYF